MEQRPFAKGDRVVSRKSGEHATVIKMLGSNTAVLRFDGDVEFNKKNGLPVGKSDAEFFDMDSNWLLAES
jgi:hypothetical protein